MIYSTTRLYLVRGISLARCIDACYNDMKPLKKVSLGFIPSGCKKLDVSDLKKSDAVKGL
jgi:hypothetical protein